MRGDPSDTFTAEELEHLRAIVAAAPWLVPERMQEFSAASLRVIERDTAGALEVARKWR